MGRRREFATVEYATLPVERADWATAAIAVVTLALLWRYKKIPEPYVAAAAGALGILLH